jgi:hypothetical protein
MLQRDFGDAEPDRHDDEHHAGETIDDQTADPTPTEDQLYTDEQAADDQQPDQAAQDDRYTAVQPAAAQPHDEAASHDEQSPDAIAGDEPQGEGWMHGSADIHRDDDMSTTHDDEPAALEEPAQHEPALDEPALDEPALDEPVVDESVVDEPTADARAAEATSPDEPIDLKPGDVPAAAVTAIWTEDSAQDLRDRWREAQLRFVDDPQKAADDTRNLVNEAAEALTAALASHREQLNAWPDNSDTEQYRVIVQRYRTFFERLLAL